jgi:hypothetical protein
MTRIEILMIAMAAQIFAKRSTGIDIAYPFMIREEVDTFTNPTWISNISIELEQALERTATARVTP